MDIKEICGKMNLSEEFANQLVAAVDATIKEKETKLDEDFKTRLAKAKAICLEELNKEKANLANKVEIFLESKVNSIQKDAQRLTEGQEAASAKTLREIKALVEGVEIGGQPAGESLEELKTLRLQTTRLSEDVNAWKERANRANTISVKLLDRVKILESVATKPAEQPTPAPAARPTASKTTVNESKAQPAKPRLEDLRKPSAAPKTTREEEPISEVKVPAQGTVDKDIATIAESIDDVPVSGRVISE